MKRAMTNAGLLVALLLGLLSLQADGQTANPGFTLITGQHIYDLHGAPLAAGTIIFRPVSTKGAAIGFRVGGADGGQGTTAPYSFPVVGGVIYADATGLPPQLPDTSLTFPLNICYSVTILAKPTGMNILGPGYSCIQPSGASWSFDAFNPNQPAQATVQTGPQGPAGVSYPPFAMDVTQPPYNAACDGSTDDSAAIQAALDQNGAILIPTSTSGTVQCEIPEGITLCSTNNHMGFNAIFGNAQYLDYSGAGIAITENGCLDGWVVEGVTLFISAPSGTPTAYYLNGGGLGVIKDSLDVSTGGLGAAYTSINVNLENALSLYSAIGGGNFIASTSQEISTIAGGWGGNLSLTQTAQISFAGSYFNDEADLGSTISNSATVSLVGVDLQGNQIPLTLTGPVQLTLNAVGAPPILSSGSNVVLNGDAQFATSGRTAVSGAFTGTLSTTDGTGIPYLYQNGLLAGTFAYSIAGTALPTCNSGLTGTQLQVSDATSPTFLGTYAGSGAVNSPVLCNGTSWVTF